MNDSHTFHFHTMHVYDMYEDGHRYICNTFDVIRCPRFQLCCPVKKYYVATDSCACFIIDVENSAQVAIFTKILFEISNIRKRKRQMMMELDRISEDPR